MPLVCGPAAAAARPAWLTRYRGTGPPYHHPVVLAKRLATIDVLSKGRMRLLTVGLGALPGEAQAAGVDLKQQLDEISAFAGHMPT
jgi:alkanesulfonate monooxygenase SsuD/methylene tetrahydromethanopterin reductase-like flavin-dependent oxidoreductase (luciferase family)